MIIVPFDSIEFLLLLFVFCFSLSFLTRYLVKWGEGVLAISKDIREYLVREYHVDKDKIALTVNGIDTEQYSPQIGRWATGKPCEVKTILHVSRIDRDRALIAFLLCRVMPKLYRRFGVRLIIVGGGELLDRLQKEAKAVNARVGKCITLVGEQSDILPFLARADLFVGVSRAALEAMACGIPTVLAGNSGYLGIFQKERKEEAAETNFCCRGAPRATKAALFRDLSTLLESTAENLCALSDYARELVEKEYSLCRMADDYEAFYAALPKVRGKRYEKNLILGYHGFDNLGDEMLLGDMLTRLRARGESGFTVLSHTPKATAARYAVSAVSRHNPLSVLPALLSAKVLYVGGGTILQSETSKRSFWYYATLIRLAKFFGKTVVFWANGLSHYSPKEQLTVAKLLQGKSIVLLRDQESFCLAKTLTAPLADKDKPYMALVADGGFLQKPSQNRAVAARIQALSPYFVLCLHGNYIDHKTRTRLLQLILMAEKWGLRAILLTMQPSVDNEESNRLATSCFSRTKRKSAVITPSAAEAVAIVAKSACVISMRFHPLVFAASHNIPALCISESEKAKRLMRSLYCEDAILSLASEEEFFFGSAKRFFHHVLQKDNGVSPYHPNPSALAEMKRRSCLLTEFLDEGFSFLQERDALSKAHNTIDVTADRLKKEGKL